MTGPRWLCDHITNEEGKTRTGNAIGPYEDLTSVKRRKLKWYGHVTRSSGLAKTVQREQYEEGDKEADRGNDGKTTLTNGLALNGTAYCGNLRIARSEGSWL